MPSSLLEDSPQKSGIPARTRADNSPPRRRKTFLAFALLLIAAVLNIVLVAGGAWAAAPVDYARQVKPILKQRCYACHAALKQKAGLRLDTGAAIRRLVELGAKEARHGPPNSTKERVGEAPRRARSARPMSRVAARPLWGYERRQELVRSCPRL